MAEQDEKGTGGAEDKDGAREPEATSAEPESSAEEEPRPGEAFKQGLGLLWKAAKSTADELKKEVDKGRVSGALSSAGQELEKAAGQAAKAVEQFIGRMGPGDPKMDGWPAAEGDKPKGEQVDADIPADGGKTEDGERRDMRIQVEEDKDKDKDKDK
ncbi:MAG: hypothetical protein JRI68_30315 [Deltaproteobacteria bacterium]|nr:hypothetical protein [Deltaproteobacteria bacterium]